MNTSTRTPTTRRQDAGFSLIEVMVALVLLTGGLLGVAYMQNYAMRFSQESYHRSQLMVSASEIIDSMRSFQISPDDGTSNHTAYTNALSTAEAAAGCDPSASTPRDDLICFQQLVANNLPFGTTSITVQAVDADTSLFNISVFWSDRGLGEQADLSDADQSGTEINLATQASCEAAENKAWSSTLTFPFDNGPASAQCMNSHTWSVQILNTDTL